MNIFANGKKAYAQPVLRLIKNIENQGSIIMASGEDVSATWNSEWNSLFS